MVEEVKTLEEVAMVEEEGKLLVVVVNLLVVEVKLLAVVAGLQTVQLR